MKNFLFLLKQDGKKRAGKQNVSHHPLRLAGVWGSLALVGERRVKNLKVLGKEIGKREMLRKIT